jgi:hypothetical protein
MLQDRPQFGLRADFDRFVLLGKTMNLEFPVLDIERKGLIRPGTKTVNLAFGE